MNCKKILSFLVLCTFFGSVYGSKAVKKAGALKEIEFFEYMPNEITNMILTSYAYHFSDVTLQQRLNLRSINTEFFLMPVVVDIFLRYCQAIRLSPENQKDVLFEGTHTMIKHVVKRNSNIKFKNSSQPIKPYKPENFGFNEKWEILPFKGNGNKVIFSFIDDIKIENLEIQKNDLQWLEFGCVTDETINQLLEKNSKRLIVVPGQENLPFKIIDAMTLYLKDSDFNYADPKNFANERFRVLEKTLQWLLGSPDVRHGKDSDNNTLTHHFVFSILSNITSEKKIKLLIPLFEKYCSLLREDRWSFFLKNTKLDTSHRLFFRMIVQYCQTTNVTFLNSIKDFCSLFVKYPNWEQSDRIDTTCALLDLFFCRTSKAFRQLLFSLLQMMQKKGAIDLYQICTEEILDNEFSKIDKLPINKGEYPLKLFLKRLVETSQSIGGAQTIFIEFLTNKIITIDRQDKNGNTVTHLMYQLYKNPETKAGQTNAQRILKYIKMNGNADRTRKNNKGISVADIFATMEAGMQN